MLIALLLSAASLWCIRSAVRPRSKPSAVDDRVPGVIAVTRRLGLSTGTARPGMRRDDAVWVVRAGLDGTVTHTDVAAARLVLASAPLIVLPLTLVHPAFAAVAALLGALGWSTPGIIIGRMARERRRAIVVQLPDVLDLLGVCVESGMALDPALRTVAARLEGPLGEELDRVIADLATGATRPSAYRDLGRRVGAPEVDGVMASLITADALGTPLTRGLKEQAVSLRSVTAQRARDRAAQAAPKMQLVVAMLMVPAVLILVVTVMGLELARQIGPVLGGVG